MRVQNAGPAVRRFARERQLRAGAIEFGPPLDQLRDVLRTFFHQQRNGFGAAQSVAGLDGVLLVQADFVFVAEGHRDAALRPGRGGIAQIGLGQDQHAARGAELDCGAQPGDSGPDDNIVGAIRFVGFRHGETMRIDAGVW